MPAVLLRTSTNYRKLCSSWHECLVAKLHANTSPRSEPITTTTRLSQTPTLEEAGSMRIAIYARYSSDHQDERSIEDQIRLCRERACAIGGNVIGTYTDYAISGAHLKSRRCQSYVERRSGWPFRCHSD